MALRLDRDNHTALNNYAYYLSLRGEKLEEALDFARRAVSIQPENPSYLDTAGWVYFKLGNIVRAKEFIQRSIDAGAESADVFEHFGDVLEAEGNPGEAVNWWRKALETDPDRVYLQQKIEQAENE
jgi:tetratricopeptide (TPR) repeat protein